MSTGSGLAPRVSGENVHEPKGGSGAPTELASAFARGTTARSSNECFNGVVAAADSSMGSGATAISVAAWSSAFLRTGCQGGAGRLRPCKMTARRRSRATRKRQETRLVRGSSASSPATLAHFGRILGVCATVNLRDAPTAFTGAARRSPRPSARVILASANPRALRSCFGIVFKC